MKIEPRFALLVLLALSFPMVSSMAQTNESLNHDKLHFQFMPYLIVPGITGDITVKNVTQSVNASAGDIFSHLQFGFMGRGGLSSTAGSAAQTSHTPASEVRTTLWTSAGING